MARVLSLLAAPIELVGRNMAWALALSLVLSLSMPAVSRLFAPAIPVVVIIVITVAFLRIDVPRAIAQWRRPERIAGWIAFLLIGLPIAMYGLTRAIGLDPDLVFFLVLLAGGAPIGTATNYALWLKLDAELALNLMIASVLSVPFIAPFVVFAALDLDVDVEPFVVFVRLAGAVAIAFTVAQLLRRTVGVERLAARRDLLDGIATLAAMSFLIGIMVGIPEMLVDRPDEFARLLIASSAADFGLMLVILAAGLAVSRAMGTDPSRPVATVAILAGNRNLGLFLTALPAALAAEITPFIALYQIPIFLTPLAMGPVMRWYLSRHTSRA